MLMPSSSVRLEIVSLGLHELCDSTEDFYVLLTVPLNTCISLDKTNLMLTSFILF